MIDPGVIERALGRRPVGTERIGGGAAGEVHRLRFASGPTLVAKTAPAGLDLEARSLDVLAPHLPVPRVLHASPTLLIMEDVGNTGIDGSAERHAADLLAALHRVTSPDGRYGLDFDNTIGPLPQANARSGSWVEFWRDRRLLGMAGAGRGRLGAGTTSRLERLASRLGELIPDRPAASLIHGDVWSGNVLASGGRVLAFLDPSPYYAHAEVELAFITLFGTFGRGFFDRYRSLAGVTAGEAAAFEKTRRHVYNVYPLLVHVRLFGGGYVHDLESTLSSLGF